VTSTGSFSFVPHFCTSTLRAYSEASQEIIPHVTRLLTKSVIPAANFWQMRPSPPPASLRSRKKQQEWCKSSNPRQAALAR
jgi:hypothetical protein